MRWDCGIWAPGAPFGIDIPDIDVAMRDNSLHQLRRRTLELDANMYRLCDNGWRHLDHKTA